MKSESVLTSELQCKASLVRGWSTSESVLAQGEKLFDIHGSFMLVMLIVVFLDIVLSRSNVDTDYQCCIFSSLAFFNH